MPTYVSDGYNRGGYQPAMGNQMVPRRSIISGLPGGGQDPRTGDPAIPIWQSNRDAQERLRTGGQGYQQFREQALSAPGQSPWEKMMMERQGTEEARARDLAQSQAAGAGQSAWSRMAMRGGSGAGARERAMSGAGSLQALQNIGRFGQQARADIGLRGEEQRQSMLAQLPGMEYRREMGAEDLRSRDYENLLKRFALLKKDWASRKMGEEMLEG